MRLFERDSEEDKKNEELPKRFGLKGRSLADGEYDHMPPASYHVVKGQYWITYKGIRQVLTREGAAAVNLSRERRKGQPEKTSELPAISKASLKEKERRIKRLFKNE